MKDRRDSTRYFIGVFVAGATLSWITYCGVVLSTIRLVGISLFMGGLAVGVSSATVDFIAKNPNGINDARSNFAYSAVAVLIFIAVLMSLKFWVPPQPCHPNCPWCEKTIEDWKEDAKHDFYENRHP